MIKLPYGIADFYRVITGGFRYVDRTAHIRHVEDLGDALLFVRPRRFGTWYDGYRFSDTAGEPLYNPTNALYFLDHLHRRAVQPAALHDRNLAMDQGKLAFLSRETAGARLITDLAQGDGTIEITRLETHFSIADLVAKLDVDRRFVASFLYYLGLLTRAGEPPRTHLGIPNLVVKKLYLDRMLELYLARPEDRNQAEETVLAFFHDGDPGPLLAFVESKLLPVLSNRDYRVMSELTVKALFLALLFDDRRYVAVSEPELARGYADLCLLVRPPLRAHGLFDLVLEFKYVPLKDLGKSGQALRELDEEQLRALPAVAEALAGAREQAIRYGRSLAKRLGQGPEPRCYAVVLVGLERLVGEAVGTT